MEAFKLMWKMAKLKIFFWIFIFIVLTGCLIALYHLEGTTHQFFLLITIPLMIAVEYHTYYDLNKTMQESAKRIVKDLKLQLKYPFIYNRFTKEGE